MVALNIGLGALIDFTAALRLLIATDSQSSVSALTAGPVRQDCALNDVVWKKLDLLLISSWDITKQFLDPHCGTARNELVVLGLGVINLCLYANMLSGIY
jgi:hypothetical protein